LRAALGQPEKLMELLVPLCDIEAADAAPGARKIGIDKDLMTVAGLKKTAAVYYLAFAQKKTSFPYFTTESVGGCG
jgi:hypothetical protein